MLRHFRNQKKILSIFLWIVIASFIGTIFLVWGVGERGKQKTYAIKINDHVVSYAEYKKNYEDISKTFKQIFGAEMDPKIVTQQVVDEIISRYLLLDEANRLKIPVTDIELLEELKKIPAFQTNGQFDKNRYIEVLRLNGLTPELFENDTRVNILLSKMKGFISSTVYVSEEEILKEYKYRNKIAEISYVQISPDLFKSQVKITDEILKKYYEKNKNSFIEPVKINAKYIEFSSDDIKISDNISNSELESFYLKNKDKFKQDEAIRARHILIKIKDFNDNASVEKAEKKAEEIYKKAISGKKFEDLAKEYSDDISKQNGGDLGEIKRGMMIKEFEDALFALKEGEISKPVKTPFGIHIIKNEKYTPKKEYSFSEVKDNIKNTLLKEKIMQIYRDNSQKKYREIAGYANLSAYAAKTGIKLNETGLFSEQDQPATLTPDVKDLLLKMDKGEMSNLIQMNGKYYIFEISERVEPTIPPLEAIKDKVTSLAILSEAINLAQKKANEALSKKNINEVASFIGSEVKENLTFKRIDPIPGIGVNSEITSAIFSSKPGTLINKVLSNGQNYYIIYTKSLRDAAMDKLDEERASISQYLLNLKQNEAYNSYINNLKKDSKIDISPSIIN